MKDPKAYRAITPDVIPRIPLPVIPVLPPRDTPSVPDQLRCPPGQHRDLGTLKCVDDATTPPKLVELREGELPCPPGTRRVPNIGCVTLPGPDPSMPDRVIVPPPSICPPGQVRGQYGNCVPIWTPNPFEGMPRNIGSALRGLTQFWLGELGKPRPKPAPRRRRAPRRTRPPARPPRRTAPPRPPPAPPRPAPPRVVPPSRPVVPIPRGLPTINPIGMVLEFWKRYTDAIGERTKNPRRGGNRTRAQFPRMPPVSIPVPATIPVELPRPQPRTRNVPSPAPTTQPRPAPSPAPRPRPAAPRARPLLSPSLLLGSISGPILGLLAPRVSSVPRPTLGRVTLPRQRLVEISDPMRNPIGDPLTPIKSPVPGLQPGRVTVASPTNDPCAVRARDARRRQRARRKQCKKFTTKTIRVCAERS